MDETPSASKRFLPPSSSSSQRRFRSNASVTAFTPKDISSSASPLPHGSRFQTATRPEVDEINGSFDGELEPVSVRNVAPFAVQGSDAIDEEDLSLPDTASKHAYQPEIDSDSAQAPDSDVAYDETLPNNVDADDTPVPKRRRLESTADFRREADLLVFSPDVSAAFQGGEQNYLTIESDLERNENLRPANVGLSTPERHVRFKTLQPIQNHSSSPEHRPTFRNQAPLGPVVAAIASILPEAFTPSRRAGANTFVSGGIAEAIRDKVLGIASGAAQNGTLEGLLVDVDKVELDASQRAIIATSTDGTTWILPGEDDLRGSLELQQKMIRLLETRKMIIVGQVTHWPLQLPALSSNVRFAAYWKADKPTPA